MAIDPALFLRQVSLFHGLPDEDLRAIAAIAEIRDFPAGSSIFLEGDPGDRLYVIVHGQVAVQRKDIDGEPVTLVTLNRLDFFGEMALFEDVRRSASAVAASRDVRVIAIERAGFTELLRRNVEIALHLVASQNKRLRQLNERMVQTDREARRHAPTLAETIEERYPHPIALVHKELDVANDQGTKLRRLLELCEVVLLYQASLSVSLYLASGTHDPAIDAEILNGQRGIT
ncbi:MAG: cyclic nucleotide-binding domain-containing protein, partial [Deltaproteobacteria bacterium]|nr:cyclic nucleotide-binding domain-containing protein [Deltaproteobacteria bacterium]